MPGLRYGQSSGAFSDFRHPPEFVGSEARALPTLADRASFFNLRPQCDFFQYRPQSLDIVFRSSIAISVGALDSSKFGHGPLVTFVTLLFCSLS